MSAERDNYAWDFFIAHAGADMAAAERLYALLAPQARVFLDGKSLKLGDVWDVVLPEKQRQSFITVVIISERTDSAWYAREEIATAIALARRDGRRVVPVYLERFPADPPYGLARLHAKVVAKDVDYADLAQQLLGLIGVVPSGTRPEPPRAVAAADGVPVFVLAAQANKADLNNLRKHLFLAEKSKILRLNYPGRDTGETLGLNETQLLTRGLDQAQVILLLVSSDLYFEYDALVDHALARSGAGTRVVPVLLSDFELADTKLQSLVALPREKGPVSRWRDADAAWAHVAQHVRALTLALKS